jgi:2-C-methyl-D-erythritol 4-phosphate cytidylyltransferase
MGTVVPKQYLPLAGSSVIEHSLAALTNCDFIESVMVVISKEDKYAAELASLRSSRVRMCHGGASRSESVLAGLQALQFFAQPEDWVLVHDAVRPCVSVTDITTLAQRVMQAGVGGILAEKVVDTIKRADAGHRIVKTVARNDLWRAQTPQMFRLGALHDALASAIESGREITDESSVMEGCEQPVQLIAGATSNLKVTVPEDLQTAGLYLEGVVDHG